MITTEVTERRGLIMDRPAITLYPCLGKVFGVCGALMIQQIHFWLSVNPTEKEGHAWTYNTYEAWAEQIEVFTADTIRKCIKDLEKAGVIIAAVHNKHKYDRTRWYRLDYEKLCQMLTVFYGYPWSVELPFGTEGQLYLSSNQSPIPKIISKNMTEGNSVQLSQNASSNLTAQQGQTEKKPNLVMNIGKTKKVILSASHKVSETVHLVNKPNKTAAEILQGFQTAKATQTKHRLTLLWLKHMSLMSKTFQKPLTSKEGGQLKQFGKTIGASAPDVLVWAMQNWWKFAQNAKAVAGLTTVPTEPVPGFLLQHCAVAMNLYLQTLEKPVKIKEPTAVQSVASKGVAQTAVEEPYKPTDEELAEVLKSFE